MCFFQLTPFCRTCSGGGSPRPVFRPGPTKRLLAGWIFRLQLLGMCFSHQPTNVKTFCTGDRHSCPRLRGHAAVLALGGPASTCAGGEGGTAAPRKSTFRGPLGSGISHVLIYIFWRGSCFQRKSKGMIGAAYLDQPVV